MSNRKWWLQLFFAVIWLMNLLFGQSIFAASTNTSVDSSIHFQDIESHWAKQEIQYAVEKGIIPIQPEAQFFHPDQPVSREDLILHLSELLGLTAIDWQLWQEKLKLHNTESFAHPATRGDAAVILYHSLQLQPEAYPEPFIDVSDQELRSIYSAVEKKRLLTSAKEKFNPEAPLTKAAEAVILNRVYRSINHIYYENKVAILTYHHLDEAEKSDATLSPQHFRSHLQMLRDYHYNVFSIEEMKKWLDGIGTIPANAVVITFDDGYESYYRHAYPFLKEFQMPAAHFLIVGKVNRQPDKNEIPKLNWAQIKEMAANGYTFYSHTYNHHYYEVKNKNGEKDAVLVTRKYMADQGKMESVENYRKRIKNDLLTAKNTLQKNLGINHQEVFFSYPFGKYNQTVIDVLIELNYEIMVTTEKGLNDLSTPQTRLKRINAGSPGITAEKLHQTILSFLE